MDSTTKIVVSMTTIPPRFSELGQTLRGILNQSRRADAIEVTIPRSYRRFPKHAFHKPEVPEGVEVIITDDDLGPASKVLSCAERYRGQNVRIVYCDDDRFAPRDWLASLVRKSIVHPDKAIVASGTDLDRLGTENPTAHPLPRAQRRRRRPDLPYRVRRVARSMRGLLTAQKLVKPARCTFKVDGYVDIAEGLGGVSVSPGFFDERCYDIPDVIWAVDDIWISGHLERQGIRIWADSNCQTPTEHQGGKHAALAHSVIEDADRHEANLRCIRYMRETFRIWL